MGLGGRTWGSPTVDSVSISLLASVEASAGLAEVSVCVQATTRRVGWGAVGLGSQGSAFWVAEAWGTGVISDSVKGTPRLTAPPTPQWRAIHVISSSSC